MATVSFAVGSVCVAIVWGTFFYPPPPKEGRAPSAVSTADEPLRAPAPSRPVHAGPLKHPPSVVSQLTEPPMLQLASGHTK
ncbi:hypothetical protein [Massilia sp. CF038]|uniref:hypothetical protein n=1 Tax=Massilia sp. CF038 TaxID=1881045 RepID=UPI0009159BC5|nr:hypothetical protein [Massilia sp. CF038]SHG73823.1 hypothetical protein SAMN05428948_1830 [Massilia sp. CF038]